MTIILRRLVKEKKKEKKEIREGDGKFIGERGKGERWCFRKRSTERREEEREKENGRREGRISKEREE